MYSHSIELAMRASIAAHDGQLRKGALALPYIVHPVHVALMLARFGMEKDVIIAGLLHDVVEDCDDWTTERVEREFGTHAASIVRQLTEDKSQSWEERKRNMVEHVPHMSPEAASVKAADKLHNLQSLIAELSTAEDHDEVWSRFNGGRERTLQHAQEIVEALALRVDPRIARALRSALARLIDLAEGQPEPSAT